MRTLTCNHCVSASHDSRQHLDVQLERLSHECDTSCVCPRDGSRLAYNQASGYHACRVANCVNRNAFKRVRA